MYILFFLFIWDLSFTQKYIYLLLWSYPPFLIKLEVAVDLGEDISSIL